MNDNYLKWHEVTRKNILDAKIFSVAEVECESTEGKHGIFSVVQSKPWAIIMPVLKTEQGDKFVMVRQWRHGARALSLEFPGGVVEEDEEIEDGAKRELREETGFIAKKWTLLSRMNPNPAFMENTISFYLAEDLVREGEQNLDEDELINIEMHPVNEVINMMGEPPYIHALMASALNFYRKASM